jgi:hypothetical protein
VGRVVTCDSCAKAAKDPNTGHYHIGCPECATRMLAHSLEFWDRRLRPDDYKSELARIQRPGESQAQAHERVKAWAKRLQRKTT